MKVHAEYIPAVTREVEKVITVQEEVTPAHTGVFLQLTVEEAWVLQATLGPRTLNMNGRYTEFLDSMYHKLDKITQRHPLHTNKYLEEVFVPAQRRFGRIVSGAIASKKVEPCPV